MEKHELIGVISTFIFFFVVVFLFLNEEFGYPWIAKDACLYWTKEGYKNGICPTSNYQCLQIIGGAR